MTAYKPPAARKTVSAKGAPKNRAAEISAARKAAFRILLAVEQGHAHSDDLLRSAAVDALTASDRHLATALVLGVLRWQIRLDSMLRALFARPNARQEPEVMVALRLGAFQILHMDRIPARAAIDESVELAKQAGHRFASGMVNAVLRKLAAAVPVEFAERTSAEVALALAHPAWMVERWEQNFGLDAAREICRYGQAQASITIRLCTPTAEERLVEQGSQLGAAYLLAAARTAMKGDVALIESSDARMQDEGSQLVAELAAIQLTVGPASFEQPAILDACAAPGGKTLILAERNVDARIVAFESNASRLVQLKQRLAVHGSRIECRLGDASQLTGEAVFDLVLADVPCSGTGTLGRNPEIRHRLRPDDLARQAERQRDLLAAALRVVRPGGRVVYSTCSLEPEENEDVVTAALAECEFARAVSLGDSIDRLHRHSVLVPGATQKLHDALTPAGALRLLPGKFGTDGFFIALLERVD